jgi:tetratricopeptide (TPR) repeat protein
MPVGSFNIAVAKFGEVDSEGRIIASEEGQKLSQWMYEELRIAYEDFPVGRPVVWHDSMGWLEKRKSIGLISGATEAERSEAAAELAREIKAHMVIYGYIFANREDVEFEPEFYVAELIGEADELVGGHELGAPVRLQLPIDIRDQRTHEYLQASLGVRMDALTWFTRGLILDLSGRHKQSLDVFKQAEKDLADWKEEEGKEILFYFIGREALFLSVDDETYLDQAETAFQRSLEINSDYARAHIGLGGVYHNRAQRLPPESRLDADSIERALAQYQLAIDKSDPGAEGATALKGHLGLGTAYRLRGEAYLHRSSRRQAISDFDQAIGQFEDALTMIAPDEHRLLAQTYLWLGTAQHERAHALEAASGVQSSQSAYEDAYAAYEQCINHAEQDFYDAFLVELKEEFCSPYQEDVARVLDGIGEGG